MTSYKKSEKKSIFFCTTKLKKVYTFDHRKLQKKVYFFYNKDGLKI